MANYCFTKYAIEGKKDVLERVADAVNKGDGWMLNSIENLGLKVDEEEYSPRAEWETGARMEERDGVSVLFFTQAYPWEHVDVIDWVLDELGEPNPNIYMLMECFEDGMHETNDNEGKYFPERYHVFTEQDEDDVYFITGSQTCKVVIESSSRSILNLLNFGANKGNVSDLSDYINNEVYRLCQPGEIPMCRQEDDHSTIRIVKPEIRMK